MVNILKTVFDAGLSRFVEYVTNRRNREQKLPPFFRFTLAWNYQETERGVIIKHSKGMAFVIVSSEKYLPLAKKVVKPKLETFLAEQLESDVGFDWNIIKEGFEVEQISANEISPAWLYTMYAYNNDVKIGSKRLH